MKPSDILVPEWLCPYTECWTLSKHAAAQRQQQPEYWAIVCPACGLEDTGFLPELLQANRSRSRVMESI